jgi:hypothetical protein
MHQGSATGGPNDDVACRRKTAAAGTAHRLGRATLGLLANGKANSEAVLEAMAAAIGQRHRIANVVRATKPHPSLPVSDAVLAMFASQVHVVLTAIGDCGSCSSCTVHDGITFERKGIPAAVIITEPFVGAARAMATFDGAPAFRWVTMPHPTAELSGGAIDTAATLVVPAIEAIVLGHGA